MDPAGNIVAKSSIDDGQQFLSLRASGESLLHAKGKARIQSYEKIELAVRTGDDSPTEPYVLYSELKDLLDKITGDLAFYNTLIEEILIPAIPFGIGASIKSGLDSARAGLGSSGTAPITIPPIILPESTDAAGEKVEASTLELPTTFLGGNITMDTVLGDISTQINDALPSTKIFGE